ncbi:hypothetical protein OE88DRAFT_1733002 [Heliocybe sulcata]|uniref:C4-dicarboxylate transporter/malic acid transport protein n=1 Tax=Heliocybe sulcata TaxID=5364 RepID=A0A5C3NAM7_9AGAM|nr:hypothetical protein OE88DRAFT_1733002 [Heliocybe sulcata]
MPPSRPPLKSWKECIRHFTWAWHTVIMGTGVLSGLANSFPFGTGSTVLKFFFMLFFWINFLLFIIISGCTIARYVMFPEVWSIMLRHPAQSMFMGAFPMGAATLINAALILNQEWHWGGKSFLWAIWAFWWMDLLVSYAVAFGMVFTMMIKQDHSFAKMTAVWLLPVVTLIVASSSGGNIAPALREHNETIAILTSGFSYTMVVIGLSMALMMITIYLARIIIHGPPDVSLILSSFITLGPLGQGGYSLLQSGQDLSEFLPLHNTGTFPQSALAGQMIFAVSFCGAYILWSMGICWIIIAICSIIHTARKGKIPFAMTYWGLIFPNGVFAMLTVKLADVLDSYTFRVFGAFWSVLVLVIWIYVVARTIPAIMDRSIFKAPYLSDAIANDQPIRPPKDIEIGKEKPLPPLQLPGQTQDRSYETIVSIAHNR